MLRFPELFLTHALLLTLVKEFKHQKTWMASALVFLDYWHLWLIATAIFVIASFGGPIAVGVALTATLLHTAARSVTASPKKRKIS